MSPKFRPQLKVRELFGAARVRLIPALTMACILTGCAAEEWDPQPVEASQSAIRFDHTDFDPDLTKYSLNRSWNGGQTHVAEFSGADAFAVLVLDKAPPGYVRSERALESNVAHLLNGVELDWGARGWSVAGRATSGPDNVQYRMFRLVGQPFDCVAISQSFGLGDDRDRKPNLIAGYFCYDETSPLSHDTAADLIRQVTVR
jgi:hypothetical protein